MDKTNAMRILEQKKLAYEAHYLEMVPEDGVSAAHLLGKDKESVFKTLVTVGADLNHYVFVLPVAETLDLKKAAKAVNVKSVTMLKQKDLFALTGYIHGGCSPVGMKKLFKTVIDETAILFDKICCSAGRVGVMLEIVPNDLVSAVNATMADICESKNY